jgi:hypothetical protein
MRQQWHEISDVVRSELLAKTIRKYQYSTSYCAGFPNRFVVQCTSEPLNTDTLFFKSISMQIITLAYQYAATAYQYADD